ncbi:MAG: hypothetical protein ACI4KB_07240, partial [Oscillospiraceae bacterium]
VATGDEHATCKTAEQFASGEVAYLLNGSTSEGTLAWGQTIGTEKSPVLGGAKVYQVNAYSRCEGNPGNASTGYSNTNAPVYKDHNMTKVDTKSAICTAAGNYAYWTCSYENGVYYKNEAGTEKFANLSATVIPALDHDMTAVPAKDPTCTAAGNYAYWTCSRENGVYYKNKAGTEKFANLSATVIPALEHNDTDNDGYCNNGCGQLIHSVLKEVSATLDGDIGLNYYIALSESVTADTGAYVQFTVNGQSTKVLVKDVTAEGNGTYKFTCWLTAKEMRDNITFKLYDGNNNLVDIYKNSGDKIEGSAFNYTLETYLKTLSSGENTDAALKKLSDATLVYGAYAQNAFNHNANSNLNGSELADVTLETLETNKMIKTGDIPEGLKLTEMTLILETETTLRLYFKSDNIRNYTFKLDSTDAVLNEITEEGLYYVEIANISAKDLDKMHTLEINNNCTLTFNALSYAYATVKADTNENICNVVKALYKYNEAAKAYFGN